MDMSFMGDYKLSPICGKSELYPLRVSELINQVTHQWDTKELLEHMILSDVELVLNIPLSTAHLKDSCGGTMKNQAGFWLDLHIECLLPLKINGKHGWSIVLASRILRRARNSDLNCGELKFHRSRGSLHGDLQECRSLPTLCARTKICLIQRIAQFAIG